MDKHLTLKHNSIVQHNVRVNMRRALCLPVQDGVAHSRISVYVCQTEEAPNGEDREAVLMLLDVANRLKIGD